MGAVDEIIHDLDLDQLAQQLDTDPGVAEAAVRQALPSLFSGLQANVTSGDGAFSLAEALTQHADNGLLDGGVNLDDVDTQDGEKIVQHIFANNPDQLQSLRASSAGGGALGGLMGKLLPILAPIVLSYIAKRLGMGSSSSRTTQSSGGLGDLLGPILGGILGGGAAGGLGDILGGGQGRAQTQPQSQSSGDIFGQILSGGSGAFPQAEQPSIDTGSYSDSPFNTSSSNAGDDGEPRVDLDEPDARSQQQQSGGLGDILGQIFGR